MHTTEETSSEKWSFFAYEYIQTGWFDYDREKTITAMRKLAEQIPQEVLDDLPPFVVFAPSASKLGELKPFSLAGRMFLYLAPSLEKKPQRDVDFTVAHEFAHIVLGHYKPGASAVIPGEARKHEDVPSEKDADQMVESWGFLNPGHTRRR
jgi:hypothetical protein